MLCAGPPPPPPPPPSAPPPPRRRRGALIEVLSNETTFTRWAYVNHIAWIYRVPDTSSPRVGRLTWYTPDGFPSIYLLLRTHWDARAPSG